MKKFIKKLIIFNLILLLVVIILDILSMVEPTRSLLAYLTNSSTYISLNVGPGEIKPYIAKVNQADDTDILIIGDSVCHQLFDELQSDNPQITIAGTNAAITPSGQYILAKEYIQAHPNATDIYLFMLPGSLIQSFDTNYGYQYSVMPFVETRTLEYLDPTTIDHMQKTYGTIFLHPLVVKAIDLSGPNRKIYLNLLKKFSYGYKPDNAFETSELYIEKIYLLCKENNIQLHLHPCPVFESKKETVEVLIESYNTTKLHDLFPNYFNEIVLYPDNESDDGVHFNDEHSTRDYLNIVITRCYKDLLNDSLPLNM